ncbi:MAG TPA: helix-turn-helix domain-containing protein, partial [Anaerolineae bacterium]|nr:helix-turn-helix domain-containing protein [Anaerolineae bacterium]
VEQLIEAGWGHDRSAGSANLIRWHISNLRRKLELDPLHPRILCTQSHFGYVLCSESHATTP